MNKLEHQKYHEKLHITLDELMADFITHTNKLPSKATILELAQWNNKQINNPTEKS